MKFHRYVCQLRPVCDSDDEGDCYTFAAQYTDTMSAGNIYYLEVGGWDAGRFCINVVKNEVPSNDCIANAISIDTLLSTNLNDSCCRFAVETHIYRPHNVASIFDNNDGPTRSVVSIPGFVDINCNGGLYPNDNGINSVFHDVWFEFTYDPATMDSSWLNVYPNDGCNFYVMNLFSDDLFVTNAFDCDTIKGLKFERCAVGDVNPLTCGNQDSIWNKSKNSFSNHPRLDLTGLTNQKYYLRVSQFTPVLIGDTNLVAPPAEGYFNLVLEGLEDGLSVDTCPGAELACGTTHCLSNAGMTGNILECNMPPASANEPLLYNNSAIYHFTVEASLPGICDATVSLEISNISYVGVNGNSASFFLVPVNCNGPVGWGGTPGFCETSFDVYNATLPPGDYYLIVDGELGNITAYDITLSINYQLLNPPGVIDCPILDDCPGLAMKTATGISEQTASGNFKLNVAPVPSSDKVAISYTVGNDAPTTIEVYNMIGEKVYSEVVKSEAGIQNTHMIDISSFTRGTYLVNLVNNNERTHAKMVKID